MSTSPRTEPRRDYASVAPHPPEGFIDLGALCPPAVASGPIELEIDFGRGMFILERAEAVPGHCVLGLEIKRKWAYRVQQRCLRRALANAHVMAGDAREVIPRMGPDGALRRAFIHFPDPWWKKRHAKRRLVDAWLLDELARLLTAGGELFIQTDVEARADETVAALHRHDAFALQGEGGFIERNPYAARSNREKRCEEDGLPVYRMLALRR